MKKALIVVILSAFLCSYTAPKKTQCVINSITITKLSATNSSGNNWDMTSGPDVYFKISTVSGEILTTKVHEDLDIGTEIPFKFSKAFPFTLPYIDKKYTINCYDYDGTINPDDFIGGYFFNPSDYSDTKPSNIKFSSSECEIAFTLNVTWD